MLILKLTQGSPEWKAARRKWYRTASRAPVVMGASRYQTVEELMTELYTGVEEDVTAEQQARFDAGHATEAKARLILEARTGEELYPITGLTDDEYLLASLDGMPYSRQWLYEHKLLNQRVVAQIKAKKLEPAYFWQLEHELIVCEAEFVRFVCSDGTDSNFHSFDYYSVPARRVQLMAAWRQFDVEYAAFVPKQKAIPVQAKERETLPAVVFETSGQVAVKDNLAEVDLALRAFVGRMPKEPSTDQQFVDIIEDCKALETFEATMKGRIDTALAQAGPLQAFVSSGNAMIAFAARARIDNSKLVEVRKENMKLLALQAARDDLAKHIATQNKKIPGSSLPDIPADFGGAAKGKRTMATLQAAVSAELSRAKAEASTMADTIFGNLALLGTLTAEQAALFADKASIARKPADDFATLVKLRIGEHERAEAAKAQKIRDDATAAAEAAAAAAAAKVAEEAAAATAAAVAAAAAKAVEDERARAADELAQQQAQAKTAHEAVVSGAADAAAVVSAIVVEKAAEPETTVFSATPPARTGGYPVLTPAQAQAVRTMNIGRINALLGGPKVDGATLAAMGFAATTLKGASLYHESDFMPICRALIEHVKKAGLAYLGTRDTNKEAA